MCRQFYEKNISFTLNVNQRLKNKSLITLDCYLET